MGRLEKYVYSDARNTEKQVLMIRFLRNNEINRPEWDNCIGGSRQGLVYAMSWYLDHVSPGWCGLMEEDYSIVMPLPVKKKYGISYIIQPLYSQQLGIFSKNLLTADKIAEFINSIPLQFKYISLNLNFDNELIPGFPVQKLNNNFELDLNREYQEIAESYSVNARRNLQKASGFTIRFDGSIEELTRLKTQNTAKHRSRIPPQKIQEFIYSNLKQSSGFICSAAIDSKTIAAVFFLKSEKRIYYLIPVSNSEGKEKKAMFVIIDKVIQKYSGSPVILDFEGSNIPGLARFFEGFGAVNHPYPSVKINRLPFPLNQFRKS
jgi:hypothetical protein